MNANHTARVTVVVVLGMHRSGTSCLAGCLESAGLYLGPVNTQAPYNARGNRENRAIMDLHDEVLAANGGAWDRPPPTVHWNAAQRRQRDALIATYPMDRAWGFKEPRSLLTLDGWLDALPGLRAVGTFRHPDAVAASLERRNGFTRERSHALWLAYNQRLLAYQQRFGFPLIGFDWDEARYAERLAVIARALDLAAPERGRDFFEGGLRHSALEYPESVLPGEVRAVYAALREIAA